jgi:hypothetical protein
VTAPRFEIVDIEVFDRVGGKAYAFDDEDAARRALPMFDIGLGELAYVGYPIEDSPNYSPST